MDTNVWLDAMLNQERAREARQFLDETDAQDLAISEFTLYSVGIILTRLGHGGLFARFIQDVLMASGVRRIVLPSSTIGDLPARAASMAMDFDDAYQAAAADAHGLFVVSYDSDFDRAPAGRLTPLEALHTDAAG